MRLSPLRVKLLKKKTTEAGEGSHSGPLRFKNFTEGIQGEEKKERLKREDNRGKDLNGFIDYKNSRRVEG